MNSLRGELDATQAELASREEALAAAESLEARLDELRSGLQSAGAESSARKVSEP